MLKKIILGVIYAGGLLLLAVYAAGAGHGTYIFFAAAMPYGLGLLIYPMIFSLWDYLNSNFVKVIYVATLAIHYMVTTVFVMLWWTDDFPYLIKTWAASPIYVLAPLLWYLIGQIVIWFKFIGGMTDSSVELK